MEKAERMICPRCGAEMNHHADKLIYAARGPEGSDVQEFHSCPACGASASRAAA
jgi:ribosomal protein S27AE